MKKVWGVESFALYLFLLPAFISIIALLADARYS